VLAGLLYLGAAAAVSPWALRGVGALRSVDAKNQARLAGAVVFGGILGPVLLLTGLRVAAAGSVSLWLNLETVATAVLARLFFKEHLAPRTWAAVGVVVLASLLLAPGTPEGDKAIGWVVLACIAWGLDNNLTSLIDRFTPAQVTFAKGIIAGSVNLGLGAWFEPTTLAPWTLGTALAALAVGAVGYGASLLLYIAGAQHPGATRSQLLFSTAPAWGLLLAWVALGEPVLLTQLLAGLLMALAMWLWQHEHHEHRHTHSPVTHRHWHRHDDGHHEHSHSHPVASGTWHSHEHPHAGVEHAHPHRPDLHHRHAHRSKPRP